MQKLGVSSKSSIDAVLNCYLTYPDLLTWRECAFVKPLLQIAICFSVMPNNLAVVPFAIEEDEDVSGIEAVLGPANKLGQFLSRQSNVDWLSIKDCFWLCHGRLSLCC